MTEIERTLDLYRRKGLGGVLKEGWRKAFTSRFGYLVQRVLGDRLHQKLLMYPRLGYWPRIRNPRTFNEKLLYRKLYTDDERFTQVEDKWSVREYVARRVGADILPEVYSVTENPDSIEFGSLPKEYVIKPTHLSGPVMLVSKESTDTEEIIKKSNEWLERTHGSIANEYWYSHIRPRILVEERLYGQGSRVPRDFKFFVFHGRAEYVQVDLNRYSNHTRRFYDREWNALDFSLKYPVGPKIARPKSFTKMLEIAECLGSEFEFIRVDLYDTKNSGIMFGELTVVPGSGGEKFRPLEYDFELGSLW